MKFLECTYLGNHFNLSAWKPAGVQSEGSLMTHSALSLLLKPFCQGRAALNTDHREAAGPSGQEQGWQTSRLRARQYTF